MTEIRKITLQFPSLRAFLAEYGERISADGMLLRSEAPPAAGSTVDIEVIVAEGMRLLRARGETLWSGAAEAAGGRKAAAIQFQELDDASRILIRRIAEQRSREGAEPFHLEAVPGPREATPRDLTVPAVVVPAEPAGAPVDSVFDLAEPPAETAADLFSGAAEAPPPARQPAPPVPLLADPDPAPLDLGEPEIVAADLQLDSAAQVETGDETDPEPAARSDLSDLFGGDEPEMTPARGRTEAFPPSFVDEVEAELEAAPETTPESTIELEPEPLGAVVPELAAELQPPPEIDFDPDAEIELQPADEPPPVVSEEPPAVTEDSPEVAAAFDAVRGPETVEIPIVAAPPVPEVAASASPPAPTVDTPPPPVEMPPPGEMPAAVETPPPAAPDDDNLLSIPEFTTPAVESPAAGDAQTELPSSAVSLRGAASRSRHAGTYFLIALLVGALAVAGYFLLGMIRGGEGPAVPAEEPTVPAAPTPVEPASPEEPVSALPAEASVADPEPEPGVDVEAPTTEAPTTEAATTEPAGPNSPLTGLDRITWNETDSETILTLVGDGAIASRQVEVVPIAGEQPRLVIKVAAVARPFQPAELEVGTSQVRRVRTGLQSSGALHVVVDLAAPGVSVRQLAIVGSRIEVRLGAE